MMSGDMTVASDQVKESVFAVADRGTPPRTCLSTWPGLENLSRGRAVIGLCASVGQTQGLRS